MEPLPRGTYSTVDEYLILQNEPQRSLMEHLRKVIRETVPMAEEIISYQMPAYKYKGMVAYFAAATHHIGLYVRPRTMEAFKMELSDYSLSKSAIRIPFDRPLPDDLARSIIQHAVSQNMADEEIRKMKKKKKRL